MGGDLSPEPAVSRAAPSRDIARQHLEAIAAAPRPAGGPQEARARAYCASILQTAGFDVREEPFAYSQLPGKVATPAFGIATAVLIGAAAYMGRAGNAETALAILAGGSVLLAWAAWWLGRHAILSLSWMRAESVNLVARRGEPTMWLMAHLDSKSQPVPILMRALGVIGLIIATIGGLVLSVLQVMNVDVAPLWLWIAGLGTICALPVAASVVQGRSPGALDDASGVGTVLMVAQSLPAHVRLGVALTSAEELGLAGARAWVRHRARGEAINVDGVDDVGGVRLTWTRQRPSRLIDRLTVAATRAGVAARAGRLLPGALVDGVALSDAGWNVVTVSRGTLRTVARIHLPSDSLASLEGDGMALAASIIVEAIGTGA